MTARLFTRLESLRQRHHDAQVGFLRIAPVLALLLLHFFLRAHHLTAQDPYIDEGFHAAHGAVVWDFAEHPGRFAQGKLLLYFWLGLFEAEPPVYLVTARVSIALFSLVTGAAIYRLGRRLHDHRAGVLALGVYAVLPLALFFERMALADPFAAGFAALAAWRSLVFARRPGMAQGVSVGIVLALMTLAKLTSGLLCLLPLAAAVIEYPWRSGPLAPQIAGWARRFLRPLSAAALVVILAWLPILLPAFSARHSDHPFVLLDKVAFQAGGRLSPPDYMRSALPEVTDFVGWSALLVIGLAWLYWLGVQSRFALLNSMLFLMTWLILAAVLPVLAARLPLSRYFMPLGVPLALIAALVIASLWEMPPPHRWIGAGLGAGIVIWVALFALPFIRADLTQPAELALSPTNRLEFTSGTLTGEAAVRRAADLLNHLEPLAAPVYANWTVCYELYFFAERPVRCLDREHPREDLQARLRAEPEACGAVTVVLSGASATVRDIAGTAWEEIATYERQRVSRPVQMWRVRC